ncbi:hypothetical protein EVAR_93408_1 [Eumeta japonica]|uniref:Uncharacterized protein n=1 Tax=Eumeta variegata TaxID=151549 RepID=A0A4C1UPR6_EUMVA|nr:hypothetical protein EVAR_93408_1 [Eumeta japonica]
MNSVAVFRPANESSGGPLPFYHLIPLFISPPPLHQCTPISINYPLSIQEVDNAMVTRLGLWVSIDVVNYFPVEQYRHCRQRCIFTIISIELWSLRVTFVPNHGRIPAMSLADGAILLVEPFANNYFQSVLGYHGELRVQVPRPIYALAL